MLARGAKTLSCRSIQRSVGRVQPSARNIGTRMSWPANARVVQAKNGPASTEQSAVPRSCSPPTSVNVSNVRRQSVNTVRSKSPIETAVFGSTAMANAINASLPALVLRSFSTIKENPGSAVDAEAPSQADETPVVIDVAPEAEQPAPLEEAVGDKQQHTFQAETKQILNIMARSLYTDKEVFLRELISNASDALEKCRHLQATGSDIIESDKPMEIRIDFDAEANTLTIRDFGVGMTEAELMENLGTIARSGSKAFVQAMEAGEDANNIIGQFGVGFYATFMVADKIEVFSRSAKEDENDQGHYWVSDGSGSYDIAEAANVSRGTKIVCHLKEDAKEFCTQARVEGIIKKYSNFVGFPIFLNNAKVNTVKALWTQSPSEVSEEEHTSFYKYLSGAWDAPMNKLHFVADVPVAIKALFYTPQFHMEKMGQGRIDPGVSLYSRKVLIQAKCTLILPDWLRFIRGVVDSEDIPLNISRENMQDSALIARIKNVLTRRVIRHFEEIDKKDSEAYVKFFKEFGQFIKEGVCTDFNHKNDIGKLLRYESSREKPGVMCSLDDYISRMYPEQKGIYFLQAPSRALAEASPYYESFKDKGVEVLFLYQPIDDFVMKNLGQYGKRDLVSVESAKAGAEKRPGDKDVEEKEEEEDDSKGASNAELCQFITETLSDRVSFVVVSKRLVSTPALIVDHESAAMRRMMQYVDQNQEQALPKQKMEINPNHPVMKSLLEMRKSKPELAALVVEQVFDNALIAADILDKPQSMLPRLNQILAQTVQASNK